MGLREMGDREESYGRREREMEEINSWGKIYREGGRKR